MATEANNSGDQNANDKVTFTPEQQAKIDEIVKEAMGRAASTLRTEAAAAAQKATDAENALAAAKAELAEAKKTGDKKGADALTAQIEEMKSVHQTTKDEVERLRKLNADKDKEVQQAKNESVNTRKQVAIQAAAGKCGFVDVEEITDLTSKFVTLDDKGRFVVLNSDGQPRLNSAYEPMSLDEFYTEYAAKKPHLVRGDVKTGIGSHMADRSNLSKNGKYEITQIFGSKSNAALANKLAMENPGEYKRMKGIAREAGLVA